MEARPYTDALAEAYALKVGAPPRPSETKNEIDARGAFIRQPNSFITPFGDGEGETKAEQGRYSIYWMRGCNWSNRPVIVRDLLSLKDAVGDQLTSGSGPTGKYGHGFGAEPEHKDPATGVYFLSQFYVGADPDFHGRATTPAIVDIREKKTVNNDYHRMTNYLEVQFRPWQAPDAPDLYPKAHRAEIDRFNDWLFPHINNAHYRMAFAQSVEAYDEAYWDFAESMDKLEQRLSENRFVFGDFVTDSDVRIFVSLVRWEVSYFRNVGPMHRPIREYPNIWGYLRELNAIPAFHKVSDPRYLALEGVDLKDDSLFRSYNARILAKLDFDALWAPDGKRKILSRTPEEIFLRHPADETPEDYASPIAPCIWNSPDPADRDPLTSPASILPVDASINPLKGLL